MTLAGEMVKEFDRVTVECTSCKSGPFVPVDTTEILDEDQWAPGPRLSDARPGKPVSVICQIRITRRMLQTEPTTIQGTLTDIEAAGWEDGEYGWACKACTEKAAEFVGGACKEDENASMHIFMAVDGIDGLHDITGKLLARAEDGKGLCRNGLLDLMTGHSTQSEASK